MQQQIHNQTDEETYLRLFKLSNFQALDHWKKKKKEEQIVRR